MPAAPTLPMATAAGNTGHGRHANTAYGMVNAIYLANLTPRVPDSEDLA